MPHKSLIGAVIVAVAATASVAQQVAPRDVEEVEAEVQRMQQHQDQLRRATLVGSGLRCGPSPKHFGHLTVLRDPVGFSPIDNGWAMTLADESIIFAFDGVPPIQRSYAVLARGDGRYSLELLDARSAKTRIDIELAACGLFVESEERCDAFCRNFADEVGTPTEQKIREVARRMAGGQNGESLERMVAAIREALEQGPKPIFLRRAFFAEEASR